MRVFAAHGFTTWGGRWRNPVDYQHFEVSRPLARRLAAMEPAAAKALFEGDRRADEGPRRRGLRPLKWHELCCWTAFSQTSSGAPCHIPS